MVRFIHTADWQLGAPNLPLASQRPLSALVEAAQAQDVKFIVCAGDVFHKHSPDQQTKDYLLQTVLNNPETFFVFMAGNHDYTNRDREYTSLRYISLLTKHRKISNAYVIEPGRYISFKHAIFWALDDWSDITDVKAPVEKGKATVAIWHGIVPGLNIKNMAYSEEKQKEHADALKQAGIDYVALGDVHRQFKLHDRCYYSGALIQTSYVDDLGALLVDLEDGCRIGPVKLNLPRKISYAVEYKEGTDTEEDIIDFVKEHAQQNELVKLKFNLPLEIYSAIDKQYVWQESRKFCLDITFDNDPVLIARTRTSIEKMSRASSLEQEIDIVLANEEFDLDKAKVKQQVMEIVNHTEVD